MHAAELGSMQTFLTQVASVVGRAETLACTLFLLALLFYMRAVSTGSGKSLRATRHTQWPLLLLSLLMSLLSLLSKEQGVTVVGACAAFDVFLHWDLIYCSLWRRKRDSSELVLSEKTVVTDVPPQQTRLTRASNGANGRNNINGLSVKSSALRKSKPHSVRSELQTMALRVGKGWLCKTVSSYTLL